MSYCISGSGFCLHGPFFSLHCSAFCLSDSVFCFPGYLFCYPIKCFCTPGLTCVNHGLDICKFCFNSFPSPQLCAASDVCQDPLFSGGTANGGTLCKVYYIYLNLNHDFPAGSLYLRGLAGKLSLHGTPLLYHGPSCKWTSNNRLFSHAFFFFFWRLATAIFRIH